MHSRKHEERIGYLKHLLSTRLFSRRQLVEMARFWFMDDGQLKEAAADIGRRIDEARARAGLPEKPRPTEGELFLRQCERQLNEGRKA